MCDIYDSDELLVRCVCGEKLEVKEPVGMNTEVVDSMCYNCKRKVARWFAPRVGPLVKVDDEIEVISEY